MRIRILDERSAMRVVMFCLWGSFCFAFFPAESQLPLQWVVAYGGALLALALVFWGERMPAYFNGRVGVAMLFFCALFWSSRAERGFLALATVLLLFCLPAFDADSWRNRLIQILSLATSIISLRYVGEWGFGENVEIPTNFSSLDRPAFALGLFVLSIPLSIMRLPETKSLWERGLLVVGILSGFFGICFAGPVWGLLALGLQSLVWCVCWKRKIADRGVWMAVSALLLLQATMPVFEHPGILLSLALLIWIRVAPRSGEGVCNPVLIRGMILGLACLWVPQSVRLLQGTAGRALAEQWQAKGLSASAASLLEDTIVFQGEMLPSDSHRLAVLYLLSGQKQKAEAAFADARVRNPTESVWLDYVHFLSLEKRDAEALPILNALAARGNTTASFLLGRYYRRMGEFEQARTHFEKLLRLPLPEEPDMRLVEERTLAREWLRDSFDSNEE